MNAQSVIEKIGNCLTSEIAFDGVALDDFPEWILNYFDKIEGAYTEEKRQAFANAFIYKLKSPQKYSNHLLNSLSIMSNSDIANFKALSQFAFSHDFDETQATPMIYLKNNIWTYKNKGITTFTLHKLSNLGLIQYDWTDEWILEESTRGFYYKSNHIILNNKNRDEDYIHVGNARFTQEGLDLLSLLDIEKNEWVLDFIVESWRLMGYDVEISVKKFDAKIGEFIKKMEYTAKKIDNVITKSICIIRDLKMSHGI